MAGLHRLLGLAARAALCASAVVAGAVAAAATTPAAAPIPSKDLVVEGIAPAPVCADDVSPGGSPDPSPSPSPSPSTPTGPTDAPFARSLAGGAIMTGATRHRLVLFTFDDGPDHRYTRDLLDALDRARVRAVFFLAARRFEGNLPRDRELADIAREIVQRGHFVGNHTMDHPQLPTVITAELPSQVDAADAVFERVLGHRSYLLRPPGGARSPRVDAYLADHGYTQVVWNLGTGDFQVRSPEAVVSTFSAVLAREENERGVRGGIVLLHDIHEWSVRAFPRIVALLEDRNCELLARGEELYDFADDPALFFAPRGDAGASAEAPFVELAADVLAARQRRARARAETHCSDLASR